MSDCTSRRRFPIVWCPVDGEALFALTGLIETLAMSLAKRGIRVDESEVLEGGKALVALSEAYNSEREVAEATLAAPRNRPSRRPDRQ